MTTYDQILCLGGTGLVLFGLAMGYVLGRSDRRRATQGYRNTPKDALFVDRSKEEFVRLRHESFSDAELESKITDTVRFKELYRFDPTTIDIKKRGIDPQISDDIVAELRHELDRRKKSS